MQSGQSLREYIACLVVISLLGNIATSIFFWRPKYGNKMFLYERIFMVLI